jgi:hypothetical protein
VWDPIVAAFEVITVIRPFPSTVSSDVEREAAPPDGESFI